MKRFLLAATALTAMTAAASAADLPARYAPPPAAAVYVPPAFTWTGFYVGANAGGAVGGDIQLQDSFGHERTSIGGYNVGGTIGYNYQFHPNWVVGIEGDIGYADIQARTSSSFAGLTSNAKAGIDGYFGTIRGRIGYAQGPWLFYATGGWAFAQGHASATDTSGVLGYTASASRDLSGYAVGGGVEYAVNQNLSLKGEYLYVDFNKNRAGNLSTQTDTHLLRLGVNYKFTSF